MVSLFTVKSTTKSPSDKALPGTPRIFMGKTLRMIKALKNYSFCVTERIKLSAN
jgi:hypothetical protein